MVSRESLRIEMLEKEKLMKELLPFNGNAKSKKLFRSLEKEVTVLIGRINKMDRREQTERNKMILGF